MSVWTCTYVAVWQLQVQVGVVITHARVGRGRTPAPVRAGGKQERSARLVLKFLRPAQVMRYVSASLAGWRPFFDTVNLICANPIICPVFSAATRQQAGCSKPSWVVLKPYGTAHRSYHRRRLYLSSFLPTRQIQALCTPN